MRRILLDESVPAGLGRLLSGFEVRTVPEMGWAGISNGRLLDETERAGFDVLVTSDQGLRWQQRLAGRHVGVIVLSTNRWRSSRPMDCRSPKRARRLALVVTLNCISNDRTSDVRKGLRCNPLAYDISRRG